MIGLLDLIEKHETAISYDLITLGLRLRDLGSESFTWGDLLVILRHLPPSSATGAAMYPESSDWDLSTLLLAEIADTLRAANWQRGSGKRKDYPKPIQRPGVKPDSKTYGRGALPLHEMAEWLGWDKE